MNKEEIWEYYDIGHLSRRKRSEYINNLRKQPLENILPLSEVSEFIKTILRDKASQGYFKYLNGYFPNIVKIIDHYIDDDILTTNKFSEKIYRIINYTKYPIDKKLLCEKCDNELKFYSFTTGYGYAEYKNDLCADCNNRMSIENRFIRRYGKIKGKEKYKEYLDNRKGVLSLDWFNEKYGEDGPNKYEEHWKYNFSQRINLPFSKISQELFWKIYKNINKPDKCRFAELNDEKRINLNKYDKKLLKDYNKVCFFIDFLYNNKVIEFDGVYWHQDKTVDILKDVILKMKGYEVLRIDEGLYLKEPDKCLKTCLKFLEDS